ncbi:hypothetical protein AC1031_021965 [Aphanomyces cochlioides]|nr:hypothetical protein AC1031_021965 [Aphanomyces cochlioides]
MDIGESNRVDKVVEERTLDLVCNVNVLLALHAQKVINLEGIMVYEREDEHFNANGEVVDEGRDFIRSPAIFPFTSRVVGSACVLATNMPRLVDHTEASKPADDHALPERKENNHLDGQELWQRPHWAQFFRAAMIKEHQAVESPRLGDGQEQRKVWVHLGWVRVHAFAIKAEDGTHKRHDGDKDLARNVLQDANRVVSDKYRSHLPRLEAPLEAHHVRRFVFLGAELLCQHFLTTQEVDHKVIERMEHKAFVEITDRFKVELLLWDCERQVRCDGIQRHHQKHSNHILANPSLRIVEKMRPDIPST